MARAVEVKVKPNAPRTAILEGSEGSLIVAVAGKPEGGEANRELIKFLSKHFGAEVRIIRGAASRKKLIRISC